MTGLYQSHMATEDIYLCDMAVWVWVILLKDIDIDCFTWHLKVGITDNDLNYWSHEKTNQSCTHANGT